MVLVFYYKDMLEKVTMQRTQQFSAFVWYPGGVGHGPRDFSRPITSPFSDSNGG